MYISTTPVHGVRHLCIKYDSCTWSTTPMHKVRHLYMECESCTWSMTHEVRHLDMKYDKKLHAVRDTCIKYITYTRVHGNHMRYVLCYGSFVLKCSLSILSITQFKPEIVRRMFNICRWISFILCRQLCVLSFVDDFCLTFVDRYFHISQPF